MGHCVISISREFGSGGLQVGELLSKRLGIPCYDREIVLKAAERSGLTPEFINQSEERAKSRFHMAVRPVSIGEDWSKRDDLPDGHRAFFAQAEIIRELVEEGPCVIVGRCSDYILQDNPHCLKVFIHSDLSTRVQRCVEAYRIPAEDMERRISDMDRDRANYYNYYTGHDWGDMRRYDLTIHSGRSGIEGAVELIESLVHLRGGVR